MKMNMLASLTCAAALAIAAPASATQWTLTGTMDPLQAGTNGGFGGGTGSGFGTITGTYDDVTNELNYNVSWQDLTSPVTVSHFHVGAPGVSGGVALGFTPSTPSIGNATLTEAQEADLLGGLWYANVHTQAFAGGEIRGQVIPVPEPSSLALLGLAGLLVARRRR